MTKKEYSKTNRHALAGVIMQNCDIKVTEVISKLVIDNTAYVTVCNERGNRLCIAIPLA